MSQNMRETLREFRDHVQKYAKVWDMEGGSHHHPIWEKVAAALASEGQETAHASDCAVHREPALPAGPCNCGAELLARLRDPDRGDALGYDRRAAADMIERLLAWIEAAYEIADRARSVEAEEALTLITGALRDALSGEPVEQTPLSRGSEADGGHPKATPPQESAALPQSPQEGMVLGEWIDVNSKLPGEQGRDSKDVLCFLNGHCGLLDDEARKGGGWGIRMGFYDTEKRMFRCGGRPTWEVTHWMPLPLPPAASSHSQEQEGDANNPLQEKETGDA